MENKEIKKCKKESKIQYRKHILSMVGAIITLLIFGITENIMFLGFSTIFFVGAAFNINERRYWNLKEVILSK